MSTKQTFEIKQVPSQTEWSEGSARATQPEMVFVASEDTDSFPSGRGYTFWAMDPQHPNYRSKPQESTASDEIEMIAETEMKDTTAANAIMAEGSDRATQPEIVLVASEATDSFPSGLGDSFWAMDPENSNHRLNPQESTASDEIEMISETDMNGTTAANATMTEANLEPTQPKEDEEESHHQMDKMEIEWNQSKIERNCEEDGHHLVLSLNEPGKETPPWASEEPGGTIVAQVVVMRLNGHTVRCFSEAFGKWTEEFENASEDTWAINNEVLKDISKRQGISGKHLHSPGGNH